MGEPGTKELLSLEELWRRNDRSWVTFDLPEVRASLEGETVHWAHFPTTRNIPVVMLVRGGAVIPHIPPALHTGDLDWSSIELRVFGDAAAGANLRRTPTARLITLTYNGDLLWKPMADLQTTTSFGSRTRSPCSRARSRLCGRTASSSGSCTWSSASVRS